MPGGALAFLGRFVQTCNVGPAFLATITGLAIVISPFSSLELTTKAQAKGRNLPKSPSLFKQLNSYKINYLGNAYGEGVG